MDKLRTKSYGDFQDLVLWCLEHKPSLLNNINHPFMTSYEWHKLQEEASKNTDYGDDTNRVIAFFNKKQNKYLYWFCPIDFVRSYLHKQCGYNDNWFIKLFWKD